MPGILEERLSKKAVEEKNASDTEGAKKSRKAKPTDKIDIIASKMEETGKVIQNKENREEEGERTSLKKEDLDAEALTQEDADILKDIESIMSGEEDQKEDKKSGLFRKIGMGVMSILCIYMVMLIYGAATTEYRYNDAGEIEPVVLSVDDIQAKNEFSTMLAMYLQTRELYETILTLDYRMASGLEDSMGIAPEYEAALDTVSTLAVQIDASNLSSRYNQIKSMLLTWIQTHCAAYCQFMSAAITQNDNNAAAEAIVAREVVNNYFQQITANIVSLGEDIGLFDLTDIKEWSPDTYVKVTYEGIA